MWLFFSGLTSTEGVFRLIVEPIDGLERIAEVICDLEKFADARFFCRIHCRVTYVLLDDFFSTSVTLRVEWRIGAWGKFCSSSAVCFFSSFDQS